MTPKAKAAAPHRRLRTIEALARAGLEPVRLAAKEGLSLINGTQFMAAQLALGLPWYGYAFSVDAFADGERIGELPVTVRCATRVLRVLVPADGTPSA